MKALLINGSPHAKGCTYIALSELAKTLEAEGIEAEILHVGHQDIRGCIACGKCRETGKCVFDDELTSRLKSLRRRMRWSSARRFTMPPLPVAPSPLWIACSTAQDSIKP